MRDYKELMEDAYGEEGNTRSLRFVEGMKVPDADEFFDHMKAMFGKPGDYAFSSDVQYMYQDTEGFGWLAFDRLYISIPEFDTFEMHEGKWAVAETLFEAVRDCQHSCWRQEEETRQFKNDMNDYLSRL